MVKLVNNIEKFVSSLNKKKVQACYEITKQVRDDSNLYVREDTGELRRSSVRGSDLTRGIVGWDTPYAKRVYFTGTPAKDRNPNASLMWRDKARSLHSKEWLELFRRKMK